MQDIAEVPLSALVALHLLSRDLLAMMQGVSVRSRDAEAGALQRSRSDKVTSLACRM